MVNSKIKQLAVLLFMFPFFALSVENNADVEGANSLIVKDIEDKKLQPTESVDDSDYLEFKRLIQEQQKAEGEADCFRPPYCGN